MLHLARARVVRGDPSHISRNNTTLQKFPVYGNKQTSLVCTSHDLLKSHVVTIHVKNRTELMLSLDAAAPPSCWQQLNEAYGDVLDKFAIRDILMCAISSRDEPSIPFVGVGNCFGNVWPDDAANGLYPCTLSLCFIKGVRRGSAILMGSIHSLQDIGDVPYLTVCVCADMTVCLSRLSHFSCRESQTPCIRLLQALAKVCAATDLRTCHHFV